MINKGFSCFLEKKEDHLLKILYGKTRKKVGVIVLIAVLMLALAVGAVALVMSGYERVAEMEATQGSFYTWPAGERVALVELLLEEGVLIRDEQVDRLLAGGMTEEETERLATQIIAEGLGIREDIIGFVSILETVKGPMVHWSPEDKAWYTDVLRENGILGSDADTVPNPIWPVADGITQAEAEKIAFEAVAEAFRFDREELAGYKASAEYYAIPGAEEAAKWMITFYAPEPDGGYKQYSGYYAVIDPKTGEVVDDSEHGLYTPEQNVARMEITPEMQREMAALYDTKGHHNLWTEEERARYMPDRFGIPDANAIPSEEAIRIAWETVLADERTLPDKLGAYESVALYIPGYPEESTESADPYWHVVLYDPKPISEYGPFSGEIDVMMVARTGEVFYVNGWGDAFSARAE